jgi:aspartate aminotransferase
MLSKVLSVQNRSLVHSAQRAASQWGGITAGPVDPILGLSEAFKNDTDSRKQLLGMGAYRDGEGKPWILPSVRAAEQKMIANPANNHEYLPIHGMQSFIDKSISVAYGEDSKEISEGRVAAVQSISGTGCIRVGFEFLRNFFPNKNAEVYVPDPTWPIHKTVQDRIGFKSNYYRYYDRNSKSFDITGMLEDLDKAGNESIVLLHVCAHNPTGCDPSKAQWDQILEVIKRKGHLAVFDSAYQGFASGNLEEDAFSLRHFAKNYDRIMLCQSYAKNFGLYGQRAGCFSVVTDSPSEQKIVMSRLKQMARNLYSNPPIYGARVVDTVLSDPALTKMWHDELLVMSSRIDDMRKGLVKNLTALGSPHDWNHITS